MISAIGEKLYPREKYLSKIRGFYHECEIIKVVTGVRRCGKSSIVKMIIRELLEQGISENDMPCERFDMTSRKSLRGEKKYYLSDFSFYYAMNTDNRINYGPALENIVFNYSVSRDYKASVGRIGKLECDFILRDKSLSYSYVQVAYTILASKETEDREYRSLESNSGDNYPKYVMTTDKLLQNRSGIPHINLVDFIMAGKDF